MIIVVYVCYLRKSILINDISSVTYLPASTPHSARYVYSNHGAVVSEEFAKAKVLTQPDSKNVLRSDKVRQEDDQEEE